MAVLPRSGEIVLTEMSQRFHIDHLGRVMDAALQGCQVQTFDNVFTKNQEFPNQLSQCIVYM